MLYGNQVTNTCVSSCPYSNQYGDSNNICQYCDSTCLTCTGSATHCLTCTGNRYLDSTTSSCVTLCPLGTYGVADCNECLSDCEDDYFQNDADRLCYQVCPSPLYGNVETKKCVATCPDGMYQDSTTIRCQFCDFNCATCAGSATNCLTCKYTWLVGLTCANPSCLFIVLYRPLMISLF